MSESSIQIQTLEGETLVLRAVKMSVLPSSLTVAEYLQFIQRYCEEHSLSYKEAEKFYAFMQEHQTEALTDGKNNFTVAGTTLMYCDPDPFKSAVPRMPKTVVYSGKVIKPNQAVIDDALVSVQSCDLEVANICVTLDSEVSYARFDFVEGKFELTAKRHSREAQQFFKSNFLKIHALSHVVNRTVHSASQSVSLLG